MSRYLNKRADDREKINTNVHPKWISIELVYKISVQNALLVGYEAKLFVGREKTETNK